MKYLLLLTYDGTDFAGWQKQPRKRTVQGVLEEAASALFRAPVKVTASGRTDAGVHALGQVAEFFREEETIPPEKVMFALNGLLPADVRVRRSGRAPEGFDCSRSAKRKTYIYSAYFSAAASPLAGRYAARLPAEPSAARMREAAELLVGKHDFAAFRASGYSSRTSEREIESVEIEECRKESITFYRIRVTGNGFLYNMVRILAGELFAVGCGKEEGITRAFREKERSALAGTMPPQGLLLEKVDYGVPLFGTEE